MTQFTLSPTAKAWLQIHSCVVLWGFTAILGKLITLPALPLVWWRMVFVTGALALVPRVWRATSRLSLRTTAQLAGTGAIVAAHWVSFYGSIKLANASVAATCIALAPAFLAIVEPAIARRPFDIRELALGVAVVPGVALVVGGIPRAMLLGLGVGVLSAFLVSIFAAVNKRMIAKTGALTMTAIEMAGGAAALTVFALVAPLGSPMLVLPTAHDTALLLVLASVCTLLPFALSLVALRHLSAFGTTLAVNLEPVYAILLAIPFFGEQRDVSAGFYAGVAIIMAAVFSYPWLRRA